jgi:hypothetical protein
MTYADLAKRMGMDRRGCTLNMNGKRVAHLTEGIEEVKMVPGRLASNDHILESWYSLSIELSARR